MNKSLKKRNRLLQVTFKHYFGWRTELEGRDETGEVGKADHRQLYLVLK